MFRSTFVVATFAVILASVPADAQDAAAVQNYFNGRQVVLKIDMPGSQKGRRSSFQQRHAHKRKSPVSRKRRWWRRIALPAAHVSICGGPVPSPKISLRRKQ
jgi:hypothetical protein